MLLGARVLQLHRPARHRRGEQRGVGRRVVGHVVAVAAGTLRMDAADFGLIHAEQFGDRLASLEDVLAMGVDRHDAVVAKLAIAADVPIDPCI